MASNPGKSAKKQVATKAPAKKAVKMPRKKLADSGATGPAAEAGSRRTAAAKATSKRPAANTASKRPPVAKAAGKRTAPAAPSRARQASRSRSVGSGAPTQAQATTRRLLEAKQARARQAPAWQALQPSPSQAPHAGFQSDEARVRAKELHDAEIDLEAIEGNVSARDRRNQSKRDSR